MTIGDEELLVDYAERIHAEPRAYEDRAELDFSNDKINGKIQRAEQQKVHTMLVIGKRDLQAGAVSVRLYGKECWCEAEGRVVAEILAAIKERHE